MNQIDPVWLRSFVAIAESGALARAAERVHRTPSALSVQLRQLEATVSARLLERTTRRVALTPAGERFLPYARRLLELQQEALAALQPARTRERWRVGFSEYFAPARLKALLSLLEDEAQGAALEVSWGRSEGLARRWAAGQLDLAVVTSDTVPHGSVLLRREALAWVAAPGFHAPAAQPLPLVLLADACPVRTLALASLERRGVAHAVRLACSGSQAVVAALRAGWGVGCLNRSAVPDDLQVLAELDARRWRSPGRLAFVAFARPALAGVAKRLKDWAR
jgi:DNA-binding transcriptional LysR family regulator